MLSFLFLESVFGFFFERVLNDNLLSFVFRVDKDTVKEGYYGYPNSFTEIRSYITSVLCSVIVLLGFGIAIYWLYMFIHGVDLTLIVCITVFLCADVGDCIARFAWDYCHWDYRYKDYSNKYAKKVMQFSLFGSLLLYIVSIILLVIWLFTYLA